MSERASKVSLKKHGKSVNNYLGNVTTTSLGSPTVPEASIFPPGKNPQRS